MFFKKKITERQILEYLRLSASDRFKSLVIYSLGGLDALCVSKGVKKETNKDRTIFTKENISLSRYSPYDSYYLNFDDYMDAFKELERLIELDRDLEKIGIRPTQQKMVKKK